MAKTVAMNRNQPRHIDGSRLYVPTARLRMRMALRLKVKRLSPNLYEFS
jgi:hypothetical protein